MTADDIVLGALVVAALCVVSVALIGYLLITRLVPDTPDPTLRDEKAKFILTLLSQHPMGLYGDEMLRMADGYLVYTDIYGDTLESLIDTDMVREVVDDPCNGMVLPRTRHVITEAGRIACSPER